MYCNMDATQPGSVLLFFLVTAPIHGSAYAYYRIYRRLQSLRRERRSRDNAASRAEAILAMKLMTIMAVTLVCWTPATIMILLQALKLPHRYDPRIDLAAGIGIQLGVLSLIHISEPTRPY